jgi:hypothetical protein
MQKGSQSNARNCAWATILIQAYYVYKLQCEVFYADVGKSARQFTEWQHSFGAWSVDNKYLNHLFYQCFLGLHH